MISFQGPPIMQEVWWTNGERYASPSWKLSSSP